MKTLFTLLLFALSIPLIFGQTSESTKVITLLNPSFEDAPRASKVPWGWRDCGFPGETPPDIQPDPTFFVTAKPQHGDTYLGMVVRDNDTWEKVGQKLSSPIEANQCYQFSIHLRRSLSYRSRSQLTQAIAEYTNPAKLQVWGGNEVCTKSEKLIESEIIKNEFWELHTFTFKAEANHRYIQFEVFYKEPVLFPYNGNILLDNASDFLPISCDSVKTDLPNSVSPSNPQTSPSSITSTDIVFFERTAPISPSKKGIIYYTSVLTPTEKEAVFKEINDYLKTDPPFAAMIYVKEKSRKQGKQSKKHLEEKLTTMGWTWEDFTIEVVKINK